MLAAWRSICATRIPGEFEICQTAAEAKWGSDFDPTGEMIQRLLIFDWHRPRHRHAQSSKELGLDRANPALARLPRLCLNVSDCAIIIYIGRLT